MRASGGGNLESNHYRIVAQRLVEPYNSPFAAGVFFVPKGNGKLRTVVDYQPLNQLTVVDQYHLPRIGELIDQVCKPQIFSKLDLHSGLHQIRIRPSTSRRQHSKPSTVLSNTA